MKQAISYVDTDEWEGNRAWLATDCEDNLAILQSFGDGALPPALRASREDADAVYDYLDSIKESIAKQPTFCDGFIRGENERLTWFSRHPDPRKKGDYDLYLKGAKTFASLGFFVFDAHCQAARPTGYFQIAHPGKPRKIDWLPARIRRVVASIRFDDSVFADSAYLTVEQIHSVLPR